MTGNLEAALQYREKGLSVLPVIGPAYTYGETEEERIANSKKPLVSWIQYQKERATKEKIEEWWHKWPEANVAIVTGAISGVTVFDYDSSNAVEFFLANNKSETPCDDTPRGVHSFHAYDETAKTTVKVGGLDIDVRNDGGYVIVPPSINIEGKEYRWLQSIFETPLSPVPEFLKEKIKCSVSIPKGISDPEESTFLVKGRRDEDIFSIANALEKGGANPVLARRVLELVAINCDPPFPEKEIDAKIKSALNRSEKRDRNLSEEIRGWILATEAWFSVTSLDKEVDIETKKDKQTRRVILHKLVEDSLLEKDRQREGYFRKIDSSLEQMDILNSAGEEVRILLPFEIHKLVKLYPKNIVVVAGEPNAGKTGLFLNIARMNQSKFEVDYFSSEMGVLEIQERLLKFNYPLDSWKVKFYEHAGNFDKVLNPNRLTIIDFLEIYDKFWEIGAMIRDIYDKLDKGIAVIAIQKNPTKTYKDGSVTGEYGIGGVRGLEKARLYLTMGHGRIKIVKGKNWRTEQNPNGLQRDFKLVSGCSFQSQGDWYKEGYDK